MSLKKIGLLISNLLIINSFMYFMVVDYIQQSVNRHTVNADYCVIALLFLALFLCLISFISFVRNKQNKLVYFLFLFGINIVLWLPKIFSIQCKGCTIA
jgi:hypothetical protein